MEWRRPTEHLEQTEKYDGINVNKSNRDSHIRARQATHMTTWRHIHAHYTCRRWSAQCRYIVQMIWFGFGWRWWCAILQCEGLNSQHKPELFGKPDLNGMKWIAKMCNRINWATTVWCCWFVIQKSIWKFSQLIFSPIERNDSSICVWAVIIHW